MVGGGVASNEPSSEQSHNISGANAALQRARNYSSVLGGLLRIWYMVVVDDCSAMVNAQSKDKIFFTSTLRSWYLLRRQAGKRKYAAHLVNSKRPTFGEFVHLYKDLRKYPEKFREYMRMEPVTFNYILGNIRSQLSKKWRNCHARPILPKERLMVTIKLVKEMKKNEFITIYQVYLQSCTDLK